jgi:hypothetical protein
VGPFEEKSVSFLLLEGIGEFFIGREILVAMIFF